MTDFSTPYATNPTTPIIPEPEMQASSAYIPPTPTSEPTIAPPVPPVYVPKHKSPLGPILLGFFLVIFLAGVAGVMYFQSKLSEVSPSPSPTAIPTIAPSPSVQPSATASASPKATKKPVSAIVPLSSPSPKATIVAQPAFDIRFGNPSTNIKQTIDEGKGDGRVINREYTSIQTGQFDEVSSSWSPRVTACYHVVANEVIAGKDIKFTFTLDDKVEVEGDLGQYDKLEAGRLYDWCRDVTTSIGKHTAKLLINPKSSVKEFNYTNNLARVDWENLADKTAPNITFGGPYNWDDKGTCFVVYPPSDNVNTTAELKIEQKVDDGAWSPIVNGQYCFKGVSGTGHNYAVHAIDARGNTNEQNKTFNLF